MAKKNIFRILGVLILTLACNMPGGGTPPPTDSVDDLVAGTITALAAGGNSQPGDIANASTETPTATSTGDNSQPPAPTACITPTVTANVNANVRNGPGTVYAQIGALLQGQTATVAGKNAEGTWWYINQASGFGWIAGSTVTATCIPASVAIIAAPPTPTPVPASGTCKDGYVWRLIVSSDKVCVTPASKAQADADNAAAASRKLVVVYGATACKDGYVWREAYVGDVVCVTPATRTQAQNDNAAAAARVDPAIPPNCLVGFVWREAIPTDLVCVTPDIRTQTAADNAAAASRVAGPDDCISGYVWREAFGGDKVCVTPAVKAQVAADNAAAPSHTNP